MQTWLEVSGVLAAHAEVAAHHSEIAFCGLAKDRYPVTPEEECVWEQAALDG